MTEQPQQPLRPPYVLAWSVFALTLFLILRALGRLLADVQYAAASTFGGMESVASGFRLDVVARTRALLDVWRGAASESELTRDLIETLSVWYTLADLLFIGAYTALVITVWHRLRPEPSQGAPQENTGPPRHRRTDPAVSFLRVVRAEQLRSLVGWHRWWVFVAAAAAFDVLENACRCRLVWTVTGNRPAHDWLIWTSWAATTLKFLMLGFCAASLMAAWLATTSSRVRWVTMRWTLWRLRVAVVAVVVYSGLLLFDPTGQVLDLVRRWLDNGGTLFSGLLAFLASLLLTAAVWIITNRVVLGHIEVRSGREVKYAAWLVSLSAVVAAAVLVRALLGWREVTIFAVVAGVVLLLTLLSLILPHDHGSVVKVLCDTAADHRSDDAKAVENKEEVLEAARTLAVWPLVTLLMVVAVALAPVPLVLELTGQHGTRFWVAGVLCGVGLITAPVVAALGYMSAQWWERWKTGRPARAGGPPWWNRHVLTGAGILAAAVVAFVLALHHVTGFGALVVLPAFLALVVFLLGEAQRWSEAHRPPPGLLLLGFTRVPTSALMVLMLVTAAYLFGDSSSHAVRRGGELPDGFVSADGLRRPGLTVEAAFEAWVEGNCAGDGNQNHQVPLVLVAAPGGGLRAAYWTASVMTELFGANRAETVEGCPGAAPSDRVFALGGASGGSLGQTAYTAGLDTARGRDWYDDQLARADFLADPLAWMLSADLGRAYLGYPGEDRARRLEKAWEQKITGLGDDFFAGTWGLGGRKPLMMLTGTRAESGCRLNIGGLRLTDNWAHIDETTCTATRYGTGQSDPAATTDLLDSLCGPRAGSRPAGLSYSSAALLSARFPYVSPSGQLYGCDRGGDDADAVPTAIVDGGYAENTGLGLLLDLWPDLERLIAAHNALTVENLGADPRARHALIVPILVEIDNHYARVAAPTEPAATIELLIPPSTRDRPDRLDDAIMEARAAAAFHGPVPGSQVPGALNSESGRFVKISPRTSPGLPAPLAWTLSRLATADLTAQREQAMNERWPRYLSELAGHQRP